MQTGKALRQCPESLFRTAVQSALQKIAGKPTEEGDV